MNRAETLAFGVGAGMQGRMHPEKRRAPEKSGKWFEDWYGAGRNDEIRARLAEATASFAGVQIEVDAGFANLRFPRPRACAFARSQQANAWRIKPPK
jgi:hypothetical protein